MDEKIIKEASTDDHVRNIDSQSEYSKEIVIRLPVHTGVDWREFLCGWGAGTMNITVTYPINKVIFRQMLHGVTPKAAIMELYTEGIWFLYRGALPPLCQKTLSMSIMFGVFEECRKPLVEQAKMNPYIAKTIAAITAGSIEATLMPLERIQTLLATNDYHKHFKNTPHAFKYIWKHYGVKEYYRGCVPILIRNGSSNALFFILRDEAQERFNKFDKAIYNTFKEFLCGAFLGVVCSTITYPLNVCKVAMQNQLGGSYTSYINVFRQIYHERGGKIRNIYYGLGLNCTRAFFSWGVMNTAYEAIKKVVYNF